MKKILKYFISIGLGGIILAAAYIAYRASDKNLAVVVAVVSFLYAISRTIEEDAKKWVEPKKKLCVSLIYEEKESEFTNKINGEISRLTNEGKNIIELNVLSTKRAIIQYEEIEE